MKVNNQADPIAIEVVHRQYLRTVAELSLRGGRVVSPGMFEGERRYVPYFWSLHLEGLADCSDGSTVQFNVSAEDRTVFHELKHRRIVKLLLGDGGFVHEV